eukprot:scaffold2151_cov178-Alexandrium_tamarense.AAC.9
MSFSVKDDGKGLCRSVLSSADTVSIHQSLRRLTGNDCQATYSLAHPDTQSHHIIAHITPSQDDKLSRTPINTIHQIKSTFAHSIVSLAHFCLDRSIICYYIVESIPKHDASDTQVAKGDECICFLQ